MKLDITPSGQACGASVRGVDLSKPLTKGPWLPFARPGWSIRCSPFRTRN
jgi:hypothetical protein